MVVELYLVFIDDGRCQEKKFSIKGKLTLAYKAKRLFDNILGTILELIVKYSERAFRPLRYFSVRF